MLTFLAAVVAATTLAIVVIGLVALLNNPTKAQNRWFFAFTLLLGTWTGANFIDSNVVYQPWISIALKFDLLLALFLALGFIGFVEAFEIHTRFRTRTNLPNHKLFITIALILNSILGILILLGLVAHVTKHGSTFEIEYTRLFIAHVGILLSYFIYGFARLLRKRQMAYNDSRAGLSLIFVGLIIAAIANVLTNVIFPLLFSSRGLIQGLNSIGYLGLVVMTLSLYAAITLQHLFDIRLIVIRALAYVVALTGLVTLFVGLALGLNYIFLRNNVNPLADRALYASLAVILAVVFPWLKKLFDKITDRLFFQDAYDPQLFLSHLNQVLATNIEVKKLLRACADTMSSELKTDFCSISVKAVNSNTFRTIGNAGKELSPESVFGHNEPGPEWVSKVIITDYLMSDQHKLQQSLNHFGIAAVIRLEPEVLARGGLEVGYILLGQKRSGNAYTSQDVRVLGIIAGELVIAMQNALHFEEIQRFNLTLQEEVDVATRKLKRQNKRLEELDNIKDDFISMASHQLRTPLTSVKGYLSMVIEGDAGKINPQQTKMLGQAFSSAQRMVFLITDLLNVSRLKTGKFVIDAVPVDLSETIREEVEQLQETAASKSITLAYKKPKTFPQLMLDEVKIRQVVMNFIDNAIYYTQVGGHINIELVEKPSTVELRVVDDGIGVPRGEQHHLFTKFYRATNARKTRPDGTGLGLFMAAKVIAGHGGSVIFSSREGKGSTFGFSFSKNRLRIGKTPIAQGQEVQSEVKSATPVH